MMETEEYLKEKLSHSNFFPLASPWLLWSLPIEILFCMISMIDIL